MKFTLIEELRGEEGFAVYATTDVVLFLESLDEEALDRVTALLEQITEHGIPRNRQKSKKLVDEIYELKAYQVRLAYLYGQRRRTILMIHGFLKKSDEWPRNHLKVAKRVCTEVQDALRRGAIQHVD